MSAGIFFVSSPVIKLIYGNEFIGSIKILQILGAAICVLFVANIIAYVLTASEQIVHVTHANITSIIMNVLLNFWFIPLWGGAGAAFSYLICAIYRLIYIYCILISKFEGAIVFRGFAKPFFATIFMSTVIFYCDLNWIGTIVIGLISYGIALIALKALNTEDMLMIRQAIPFLT